MTRRIGVLFVAALLVVSCAFWGNTPGSQPTVSTQSLTAIPEAHAAPTASPTASSAAPLVVSPSVSQAPAATSTAAAPANAVQVTTFDQEVYPFQQNGSCSLGEAIWAVETQKDTQDCQVPAGSTTIDLPTGIYTLTQPDASSPPLPGAAGRFGFDPGGFPVIYTSVTILGNASTIQRTGSQQFGLFQVTGRGNLTLDDLTLSGGDNSNVDLSEGGALDMLIGQATFNHVTVTGNRSYDGGALANGPMATLTLNDSVVTGNTASDDGGGVYNSGTLVLKNSIVSSNIAQGQSLGGGGIYNDSGTVSLNQSQLVGNLAFEGGGIYSDSGTVNITNQSVVSGNIANEVSDVPHGGGGINSLGADGNALVTIQDSFVIGNSAPKSVAGGIYVQGPDSSSTVLTITDSVLADNSALASGGVLIDTAGTGSITGSCIVQNKATKVSGNTGGDIDNGNQDQVPFAAANNWWGSAGGAGSVSAFVTTEPVLSAAPAICAGALPTPYPTPSGQ